jgi:hypothetical protein
MDLSQTAVDVMRVALFVVVILVGATLAGGSAAMMAIGSVGAAFAVAVLYVHRRGPT